MGKYETLFTPIQLGSLTLRSRTIQSGMVSNLSNEDGTVSEREIAYFVERAKNGFGIQLVGASYVEKQAHAYKYQLAMDRDEVIPGLKKLTDAVHAEGGIIGVQIWHGGSSADPRYSGMEVVSASARRTMSGVVPHELTKDEIKAIVGKFADAAERAKKGGFDLIEIHGTHGYLIDQFFSPTTNFRTDEYGGSLENRMRFALEVTEAIRNRVGADYPISFRITSDDFAGEFGNHVEDAIALATRLVDDYGVQLINVSCGGMVSTAASDIPEGALAENASKVKAALNGKALVSVSVRIKRPELAEQILAGGMSDLVTMGRATICDPEILTKAKEGRDDEIRLCASCNYCIGTMMAGNRTACMQNPFMGHEAEYDLSTPADVKKKVLVVGGGPAGLQAAVVCAKRGHDVTVMEATGCLGGKVNVADKSPFKHEMEYVISNLATEAKKAGVKIELNTAATKASILAAKPDTVVVATGAVPVKPAIPGVDQDNVFFAHEVILETVQPGKNVVIIGGGTVGIEAADHLLAKGHRVTVVEMQPAVMMDLNMMQQVPYMMRVFPTVSGMLTNNQVLAVNGRDVALNSRTIKFVDSVVLAAGFKPVNALVDELKDSGIEVVAVGDAVQAGKVFEATHTAAAAAYKI